MFTFTGLIIKEEDSYTALCPELDVASWGDTPEDAQAMLLEAATLHLEGAFEDGLPYLRPVPANDDPRLSDPKSVHRTFRFRVDVAVRAYA
ncbi:MAG: type II toxin-antitoxin system HicB family antitoxin [Caldilineaceae bacterium]|nr:type II toxin-antitoxin system HicB family antitoxin [Caldilineaceae bacterium]HRJ40334.1 type II toxin-antitoxin system HicB family antitoxin [Caldilineaceae bacterium]